MRSLDGDPWPENLDIRPCSGRTPWLRIRVGSYRILLRPLTDAELAMLDVELPEIGYYVARVVDKQYFKRALRRVTS